MARGAEGAGQDPSPEQRPPAASRRRLRWGRLLLVPVTILVVLALGIAGAYVASALRGLPPLAAAAVSPAQTSYIYDLSGKVVEPVPGAANRTPVSSVADVPLDVQHAFVASADPHFYRNPYGIDVGAVLSALWAGLTLHAPGPGPDTIAERLALDRLPVAVAGSVRGRLQAAVLALELTRRYTRDELLTMYLNQVELGQGAHGIGAAAEIYFGVAPAKLTLGQGALLAALAGAPAVDDPYSHPQAALQGRDAVLGLMRQQGYITAAQAGTAEAESLPQMHLQAQQPPATYLYPAYVDAVVAQLQQHFSDQQIYTGGLRIYTALSPSVQRAVESAMHHVLDNAFPLAQTPHLEAAAVVLSQANGDVEAIVGGREQTGGNGPNRATAMESAPGSAIMPLAAYVPALQAGMTAATVIDDAPMAWPVGGNLWIPTNNDDQWQGLTTLREGLRRSVNELAARILAKVGVARGYQVARSLGLTDLSTRDESLPLALGGTSDCCTPLEMARAYAAIANGGYRINPLVVLRVTDAAGDVLYQVAPSRTPVMSPQDAYVMTSMLESVVESQPAGGWIQNVGTAPAAAVPGWPTAGQPGMTAGDTSGWFVGYTPALTAAIWGGYDSPQVLSGEWGSTYGASIFRTIMAAALKGRTPTDFARPDGIVTAPIDAKSGELPGPLTPAAWVRNEIFVQGTQPSTTSSVWVQRQVDSADPTLLWDVTCGAPPSTQVFLNRPAVTVTDVASMAVQLALPASRLIPADMALAPPQHTCSQATATATGTASATATGSATATATTSATPSATASATATPTASASATGTASATASATASGTATSTASASATGTATATGGSAPAAGACETVGAQETCALTLVEGQPIAPAVIRGHVGEPLELAITAGTGAHRLVIAALNVDVTLQPGQSVTLLRTLTQAGTFPIFDALAPGGEGAVLVVQQRAAGG